MEPQENSSPLESESFHEETKRRNKTKNHARRFSDEQIKSLESVFKLGSKLDPRKKLQIASDLGLHPRQVAIWFQNRRARWKSKQIEQEYKLLKSDYNTLAMRFEDMKREKLSLQLQLQELNELVKNLDNVKFGDKDVELKEYPNSSSEGMDHNDVMMNNDITNYFEKTEADQELVSWGGGEDQGEAELSQTWHNLSSSGGLFGQSDWEF